MELLENIRYVWLGISKKVSWYFKGMREELRNGEFDALFRLIVGSAMLTWFITFLFLFNDPHAPMLLIVLFAFAAALAAGWISGMFAMGGYLIFLKVSDKLGELRDLGQSEVANRRARERRDGE